MGLKILPIFQEHNHKLSVVPRTEFASERELQRLVESNLEEVFGCRFVATEFHTGSVHSGRIDTLALSEDGNPVIIEYKKVENSSVVTQGLFYLDWIKDHKGDFQLAVQSALGEVSVDWSHIRVICIAPSFDRYSLHAVKHMGSGLELWQYHRYTNGVLEIEEVYKGAEPQRAKESKSLKRNVEASELAEAKNVYSYEDHLSKADAETKVLVNALTEFIAGLDDSIAEVPQKFYIAYKLAKNLACVEVHRKKVVAFLNLEYSTQMPHIARDVSNIGHYGTGKLEVSVSKAEDLEDAFDLIRSSYLASGGN
jgi:predicted transport protein